MTTKNNFTRAPEGIPNITATAFYDTDSSRWQFEEAFKILHSGNRGATIAYYINSGNVDSDVTFSIKGARSSKINFLEPLSSFDTQEIETWNDDTLDSEIINYLSETPRIHTYETLNDELKDNDLEIVPSKNLIKVSIRGYSQGDYAEVFYCPEDLQKAWGNTPKEPELRETFTHLFYDAPIYASVTIDGEEYVYHNCPEYSEYEFKRQEFLAYVAKESGVSIELIDDILPKEPSY